MEQAETRYTVIFPGCTETGDALVRIKARIAATFKMSAEQVDRLCGAHNVIVRKDVALAEAEKYQAAFARAGAACRIVPQTHETATRTPAAPPSSPPMLTLESLAKFFTGSIPKVGLSVGYRFGLLAVASVMVLLPVLYVVLLIGVGYVGVWYALHAPEFLGKMRPMMWLIAYGAPLVSALVVCLAMLKPLLAREPKRAAMILLSRSDEPLFFAFIDKICDTVGARRPARVQVDCAVNASAALLPGARGLYGGELTLTVGMPLVAGLDTRQLAGVLAHEFGHFAQRAGMRASSLIHRVNHWLYKCVYLRDSWDEQLVVLSERLNDINGLLGLVMYIARGAIWLARRMLWLLMWLGVVVSRYMSREMEFDADRYEAGLAGSKQFGETAFRFRLLNHAYADVYNGLRHTWAEGKLVDNLPHLIARRAREMASSLRRTIESEIRQTQTVVYDTHPADSQRIESAEKLAAPGVFIYRAPASVLLKNYHALAKRSTWHFYRAELELDIKQDQLVSIDAHETMVSTARKAS